MKKLVPWGTDGRLPLSDLDLDLGSGHTAYRRASLIDLYLYTKFHSNRRKFLWTDGRTFSPLILLGRLLEVDLKKQMVKGFNDVAVVPMSRSLTASEAMK